MTYNRNCKEDNNTTGPAAAPLGKGRETMANYYIRDAAHAAVILDEFRRCGDCGNCGLNTPEGWRCSHMAEQAEKYLKTHREEARKNG